MKDPVIISAAVEGIVDEAVARKLIVSVSGHPGTIYGKSGKEFLRRHINAYNHAARHSPWIILVDLNHEAECAPPLCKVWISDPAPYLCFRVAVREVESWLMADAESLHAFLGVARSRIPANPENLMEPKTEMVNIARQSKRREIREDMVPREGSGRSVGPAYASRLIEYVETGWRPQVAAKNADSLRRTMVCLKRLIKKAAK
uniref:DUF4276 family protein n=1 Tax=Anaerolinea thermolimosa TaxID=229919 RepID=A0A7C4KH33_9CHLR